MVCAELVAAVDGGELVRSGICFGGDGGGNGMWGGKEHGLIGV